MYGGRLFTYSGRVNNRRRKLIEYDAIKCHVSLGLANKLIAEVINLLPISLELNDHLSESQSLIAAVMTEIERTEE